MRRSWAYSRGAFAEFLAACGFRSLPYGEEGKAWEEAMERWKEILPMVMAGRGKIPTQFLPEITGYFPFLRLPKWSDLVLEIFPHIIEPLSLTESERAKWQRRFLSDYAGLEALLGPVHSLAILTKMSSYYPETIAKWPKEERVGFLWIREDQVPRAPAEEDFISEAKALGFIPSEDLWRKFKRCLPYLKGDEYVIGGAMREFLYFHGVPRLPVPLEPPRPFSPESVSLVLAIA
jgi:hypothetical protein